MWLDVNSKYFTVIIKIAIKVVIEKKAFENTIIIDARVPNAETKN